MRVLVLHGGASPEREVSLATGRAVAGALGERRHETELLDPWSDLPAVHEARDADTRGGHRERADGTALRTLVERVEGFAPDVVFVALHGGDGEDGTIQAVLEMLGVPYTGSGVAASALAMDKVLSKELFVRRSVPTPEWVVVDPSGGTEGVGLENATGAVEALGYPVVAKPVKGGSTVGTTLVRGPDALSGALAAALEWDDRVLVERYIPGRELTVAVLDGEGLPIVEIRPEGDFYDYEAKYTSGRSAYEVPARVSESTRDRLDELGRVVYGVLGCSGVARVDFRLSPDEVPYCLEANVVPGMTATSLVPKAAAAVGMDFPVLIERLCRSALDARRR
jgi:D-alanine-D-alanine ligase